MKWVLAILLFLVGAGLLVYGYNQDKSADLERERLTLQLAEAKDLVQVAEQKYTEATKEYERVLQLFGWKEKYDNWTPRPGFPGPPGRGLSSQERIVWERVKTESSNKEWGARNSRMKVESLQEKFNTYLDKEYARLKLISTSAMALGGLTLLGGVLLAVVALTQGHSTPLIAKIIKEGK